MNIFSYTLLQTSPMRNWNKQRYRPLLHIYLSIMKSKNQTHVPNIPISFFLLFVLLVLSFLLFLYSNIQLLLNLGQQNGMNHTARRSRNSIVGIDQTVPLTTRISELQNELQQLSGVAMVTAIIYLSI